MFNRCIGIFTTSVIIVFAMTSCNSKKSIDQVLTQSVETPNISNSAKVISSDIYITNKGELTVTLVGHASLIFEYQGEVIHVDPYSKIVDYSVLPKADLILLTHEHADHMDTLAINLIKKEGTLFILPQSCYNELSFGDIINNGENKTFGNISIDAVPAYNIVHKGPDGQFYHPKGRGNGYVLSFGDKKVYIAGDTENIPEMENLKADSIYIAFLPKNLPYTMSDEMFVDAVKKVSPVYLYPYHFSEFNVEKISDKLKEMHTEILVRPMSNI